MEMNRYDFTTDNTGAIFEYADENGLIPDFVKQSSHIGPDDVAEFHDRAFADEDARLYPCHTKEATILSAVYSQAQGDDTPGVREKIASAAAAFGVSGEVDAVFKHYDTLAEKVAAKAEADRPKIMQKFALTLTDEDGTEHNMYDISTRADTLVSIRHLGEDYDAGRIPPHFMRKVATEVCSAAAEQGVYYVPQFIVKYATSVLPDYDATQTMLATRGDILEKGAFADYVGVVDTMFDAIEKAASAGQAMNAVDTAMGRLCALDLDNGIVSYSSRTPDPYDILCTGTRQVDLMKDAASHVWVCDIPVPVSDLRRTDMDIVRGSLSKSASDIVGEVMDTLSSQEPTSELTSACTEKLASLPVEVRRELLRTLSESVPQE